MNCAFYSAVVSMCLMASTLARADCSPVLAKQYADADRVVDSLRPEKPAQMRVFAHDGSEYTAGEALWMKAKLRSAIQACARGDNSVAASTLNDVTDLLNSHHRKP